MNPTTSAEQSKAITQVNALVEINPQSVQEIEVDWYSNIIPVKSFKGWLIRVFRPVLSYLIPFPEPHFVLSNLMGRVQQQVKEVLRNRGNDRLQTMQGRNVYLQNMLEIDDNFYSLLNRLSKQLQIIFDIRPDDSLNLVKVKAIGNFDAALQREMPIKQLAEVAESGSTTENGWNILKNWFVLFQTEGRVICAGATLKAFAGSLFCQHNDYNESVYLSRLLLTLLKKEFISLSQFDTTNHSDDTWKKEIVLQNTQYELGAVVLNESLSRRYFTLYKTYVKESKENEIDIITSRNEMRIVEWYGLHQRAAGPIKPMPIVKLDEQYRYIAVRSPQAYFDTIGKSSVYLKELGRIITECVQSGISSLPEHHALVLFEDTVHSLVPFTGKDQPFWMHDLAEWVFGAVSDNIEAYKQVVSSQKIAGHAQYRFFSELVRNFVTGQGSQDISEIANRYRVVLDSKQVEIAKFSGQLKDLRTGIFKKDSSLVKQLEDNHLIFPFCLTRTIIEQLK